MNYCKIKYHAIEDGVGCRTVLFVCGCRHHCKHCFQPETWDFNFGKPFTEKEEKEIIKSLSDQYTAGLTLLGGEPFEPENQKVLKPFIEKIKELYPEKSLWAYSGYTLEELLDEKSPCHTNDTLQMLKQIDVLVDGEFVFEKKNIMLPYRGSENQRVLDIPSSLKEQKAILSEYHFRNR